MAKKVTPKPSVRVSVQRLPYVDVRTDGAVVALIAALAFNELSQHDTRITDIDIDNNIVVDTRLHTTSISNAVLTCAATIVDQLRAPVATVQRRATMLDAIASMTTTTTTTRGLTHTQIQQLVFSFVVNNSSRQPVADGASLFTKEQLIFNSTGT